MKGLAGIIASLAAASTVAAHATFQQLWVSGVDKGTQHTYNPSSNSPVSSVTGPSIACNVIGTPATSKATVAAGSTVQVEMHQHADRSCSIEAIGGNHDGPTIIYMAKVDDALDTDFNSARWFKVAQTGLVSTDYWGTDVMNANCGKVPFTIPSCLAPGDYLIRAEVIALHVAGGVGGAQFYLSCYAITVTGTGTIVPSSTVSFPGAYNANDPGILFNLYGSYSSYTVPGPAVWTCASGGTTPPPTSSRSSTRSSSTTRTGTGAPLYGQCGGSGWTGPTFCAQGTCTRLNDFYSQCVP